jgi:ElaB/YqjD/DUF883 family membrane-anchored ribosome-binding protein
MNDVTAALGAKASRIAEQLDDIGHQAAESLHAAASSVRKGGQESSEAIEELAKSTASKLDHAGTFVERHNLKRAAAESRGLVRRFPVESLVMAAGVGFLTGFAVRQLAHSFGKTLTRASVRAQNI